MWPSPPALGSFCALRPQRGLSDENMALVRNRWRARRWLLVFLRPFCRRGRHGSVDGTLLRTFKSACSDRRSRARRRVCNRPTSVERYSPANGRGSGGRRRCSQCRVRNGEYLRGGFDGIFVAWRGCLVADSSGSAIVLSWVVANGRRWLAESWHWRVVRFEQLSACPAVGR